ncbi:hypothetical protein ACFX2K_036402 [Malus domestica]
MFQNPPTVSSALWESYPKGACLCTIEFKQPQLSAATSYGLGLKHGKLHKGGSIFGAIFSASRKTRVQPTYRKREAYPQNVDLPPVLPKNKKKPYPIPLNKIKQAAKEDKKLAELGIAQLLHVIPVYACTECSEVHVSHSGHHIQDCLGATSAKRRSFHSWIKGSVNDVLVPIEAYHLYDPFGRHIKHETRFQYDRIPAVVELCIQAGVEIPEYPSRRRTKPIRMIGRKVIYRGGLIEEPQPGISANSSSLIDLDTHGACGWFPPPPPSDIPKIAQETMDAYETVKLGVTKLMDKYTVKACGYCSEVHLGPWGHNAKLCGEFKHQWRDGKHGWQDATVDEVFPPNYIWYVEDPKGPPLKGGALKKFYGKAPADVEVCLQAGAQIPEKCKPMMRLDIVVPESEEAQLVA